MIKEVVMEKKVLDALRVKDYNTAVSYLSSEDAEVVSNFAKKLSDGDFITICHKLEKEHLAKVFVLLDAPHQRLILEEFGDVELEKVMESVSVDDTIDIIEDLPSELAIKITEKDEVITLLRERRFPTLKPLVASMNAVDISEVFEEITIDELPIFFRILPKSLASEAFVELDRDTKHELINKLTDTEIKSVIDEMFIDDTVDLIEEMPANVVKRLLHQSDKETRAIINEILKYPKDSAGSIMTTEYVSLRQELTVKEAFEKIRATAIDSETIYTCYVTDNTKELIGFITAKALMLSSPDAIIGDIMETNVIYGRTLDDKEDIARKISDYGFLSLPIVDNETRLVGIVTVDDAIDVIEEEVNEDIAKMAATIPNDTPYLKTSPLTIFKNRIPWLLVLMISATFTGLILNTYEAKLSAISSVLFACVPMMMDTGGNCGSQASVTVIRALSLGELKERDVFKVMWKEIRAAVLLGITLASACFVKLLVIDNLLFGFEGYTPIRCAVVSLALLVTVIIAKIVGSSLPIIAKKCKLDPAVVASPFITTIVDALSLVLYCNLAVSVLS